MKFRKFRLQNAAPSADGGGTTLTTGGVPSTPAATSTAPADAVPAADAGATQQATTDAAAKAVADAAAAATKTPTAEEAAAAAAAAEAAKGEKVAPEKYDFKAPDGMTLDVEALGEFEGIAKELKLSQEDAQKVTDIGAKLAQKWEAKQADAIQQAAAEWAATATADKEYGGDKLPESLAVAKKALDAFGTPELRSLLEGSRLGNHPEVIRFMVRAGKAISEDRMVTGGAGPTATQTTAKALYPNQS